MIIFHQVWLNMYHEIQNAVIMNKLEMDVRDTVLLTKC